MKKTLSWVVALLLVATISCKKEDETPPTDGGNNGGGNEQEVSIPIEDYEAELNKMTNVSDVELVSNHNLSGYTVFKFNVIQPVDHDASGGETFEQRVTLMVRDEEAPVVMNTQGYGMSGISLTEIARITSANQIRIEHRYFGTSAFLKSDWEYLNVKQAAADHHEINLLLRKLMPKNKYISTGVSKGGETAIFYKRLYPDDLDVVVNYVGPLMVGDDDPRFSAFINSREDESCQQLVHEFMIRALELKDTIAEIMQSKINNGEYQVSKDLKMAVDYAILETEVSLWQYGAGCSNLPYSDNQIISNVLGTARYCTDGNRDYFAPYYYQSFTELGNYVYDTTGLSHLLEPITTPDLRFFAPDNVTMDFDPNFMTDIFNWLGSYGNQMIHVYGENDPWTAGEVADDILTGTNAIKAIAPGANHGANIRACSPADQSKIKEALESWLEVEVDL